MVTRQCCHVGHTPSECRLVSFQDSDFAGDLVDRQSTSGGMLCVFGSRTCVPIDCSRRKQTAVSHSRTKADVISCDAGRRLEGVLVLTLWDLVIEVLDFQVAKNVMRHRNNNINPKKSLTSEKRNNRGAIFCPSARTTLPPGSMFVCFWRQRCSDQGDHQSQESDRETRFPNPPTCARLVVRQASS